MKLNDTLKAAAVLSLILLSILTLMASSLYVAAHGRFYDAMVNLLPAADLRPRVLIIERDAAGVEDDDHLERLLVLLDSMAPRAVVVDPWRATDGPLSEHAYPLILSHTGSSTEVYTPNDRYLLVPHQLPPLEQGVAREAWASLPDRPDIQPSLAGLAAGYAAEAPGEIFRVNFLPGDGYIPVVDAARVLSGDLLPQLVAGRVVLIGDAQAPETHGLVTPLTRQHPLMSPLLYQGYAIDTLLSDSEPRLLPVWQQTVLLALLCVLMLWCYQRLNVLIGFWLTLVTCLGYLILAALGLYFAKVLLPVVALVSLQLICFLTISYAKRVREVRSLTLLLWGLNAKVKERMIPRDFSSSDNPWPQIAALINQTLQLKRTILLEARPDDPYLHEIQALHCSLDDIAEQRRDYRRSPFQEAYLKRGALRLASPFLSSSETDEIQYLVPLFSGNLLLGYWAFGIGREQQAAIQRFDNLIDSFASQVAELIGQRSRWHKGSRRKGLGSLLNLSTGETPHQALAHTLNLIEKRMTSLELYFDVIETGVATFDLFGQLTYANRKLESLAGELELRLYEGTALDLLVALTGLSLDQSREHLRNSLIDGKEVRLVAERLHHLGHLDLHVRSFIAAENTGSEDVSLSHYQSGGFIFEVVDLSQVSSIAQLREELLIHYQAQLRNDLGALSMAHQLIHMPGMTPERVATANRMIEQKLAQSVGALGQLETELGKVAALADAEVFPMSVAHLLSRALRKYELKYERPPEMGLNQQVSTLMGLVMVDKEPATDALVNILSLLVEDSKAGHAIQVEARETQIEGVRSVTLTLRNRGYGIPPEKLQAVLNSEPHQVDHPLLRELVSDIPRFAVWGAKLEIDSELDRGYEVRMALRGLQFHG